MSGGTSEFIPCPHGYFARMVLFQIEYILLYYYKREFKRALACLISRLIIFLRDSEAFPGIKTV